MKRAIEANAGPKTRLAQEHRRMRSELVLERAEWAEDRARLLGVERELEASLARYADLYDFAPAGYVTLDHDGCIHEINLTLAQLLGFGRKHLRGKPILTLVASSDRRRFLNYLAQLRKSSTRLTTELHFRRRKGPDVLLQLVAESAPEDGEIGKMQIRVSLTDVTVQRETEIQLLLAQDQLQRILEITPTMLARCSSDMRYLFVNRAYAELLGHTFDQVAGKPIGEILLPAAYEALRPYMEQVLQGHRVEYEAEITYPRAGQRYMRVVYMPDRDPQGIVRGWIASLTDLTERKRSEEALRESEERFRNMAEAAPVMIWMSGPDKQCSYFNRTWLEFTGRTLEQELNNGWAEGLHPDDMQRCLDCYTANFDARKEFQMEYRLRRHDGEYRWILDHGTPRFTSAQTFVGFIGSCMDITERKEAEETLRQAHDKLEGRVRARTAELRETLDRANDLYHHAPCGYHSLDRNGVYLEVNDTELEWLGFTRQELVGQKTVFDLQTPASREIGIAAYRKLIAQGSIQDLELEFVRKDGSLLTVLLNASVARDAHGRFHKTRSAIIDVTARKRAEEALRASEAKFRGFLESAPDAMVILDERGRIQLINSQTERLFGYSRRELLRRPVERLMPARYRRQQGDPQRSFFADPRVHPMGAGLEPCGRRKDGKEFPIEVSLSPLPTQEGVLVCAAIRDVTDRKRAEKTLRESETRLKAILDNSPAMIYLKDPQGRYLHFNRRFEEAFHLSPEQTVGKTDAEIFPPDQAAAFRANDLKVLEEGIPLSFDEVAMQSDGPHTSIVTKYPLYDENGKIYALGGIATDITERKRLEQELLQIAEREQRRIAQDLHDGLGQQLAGISCLSNVLKENLSEAGSSQANAAARVSRLLETVVAQTRSLAQGLHPVEQEVGGLMSALEDMANNISDLFKVSCRFNCPEPVLIEDNAAATHLYRIAQEAVTNALKHGRAQRIGIKLSSTPQRITLSVSDNGLGFKKPLGRQSGLGLRIMNHRADNLGGTLVVRGKSGGGSEVICTIPSPPAKATK
jgi:PAS domain S-box-containing protein